ncbi:putative reverse transcriptase domain-containing protein [Tanacetum coccineum]
MLRAFPMSLTGAASHWLRNEPSGSITNQETMKTKLLNKYCPPARRTLDEMPQHYLTDMHEVILFYNGLDVPTRQILNSKGVIPTKTAANAKVAIQKMTELAVIQDQLNNLGREIKKVNEKVYTAQVGCELCKGPYYTKDCPLKEEGKTIEEAYYTQFGALYQPGGQSIRNQGASIKTLEIQFGQMSKVLQEIGIGSLPSSTEPNPRDHVKSISTAKAGSFVICHIGSGPYAVSDTQYSSLSSETFPFPNRLHGYCCDNWKEAHKVKILETYDHTLPQKEKDPGSFILPCFIRNNCFDKALIDLGASVSVMPFSTYSNLGLGDLAHTRLTIELTDRAIKHPRGIAENMLVRIGKFIFHIDFVILDIPEDDAILLILGRPFLSTAHAKIDVLKRKITLRVGEEKLVFKSIKLATNIIRRVYMVNTDLGSKTEFVREAINKSFDLLYGNYIELNDLDMPLEPRMNQDDFEPTLEPTYKSCYKMKFSCMIRSSLFCLTRISPSVPEQTTVETVMNMTSENRAHFESEKEAIHLILTGIGDEIYSTIDTNIFWSMVQFTSHDGETIESYYTRFYKMMNEMIRNNLTVATMQVNVQFLQQLQPEWSRFVTIINKTTQDDEVSNQKTLDDSETEYQQ